MAAVTGGQVQPAAANARFEITSQTPQLGVVGGKATQGYQVAFTTGKGVEGSVFVPLGGDYVANARAAVAAHALELDQVQGHRQGMPA